LDLSSCREIDLDLDVAERKWLNPAARRERGPDGGFLVRITRNSLAALIPTSNIQYGYSMVSGLPDRGEYEILIRE
jgi:hypothetical protein